MSYQTNSKRSLPFCLLIGQKNTKVFWHQSEVRTAATVCNWSGKTLSQGLLSPFFTFLRAIFFRPFRLSLAPTICPRVSEDAFEEYRAKSQASGKQKETRERSSRVMGRLPGGYKITVRPSLHTSKTLDKIDGRNVAFSLISGKRGLFFFYFIPSKIEGGVGIGET